MESQYWKEQEVKENFEKWLEEYEGCTICACDHGCNQWLKEQRYRSIIIFRILAKKDATTKLEKVTQMPLEQINKIYRRIQYGEMKTFNRNLREERKNT